MFSADYPVEGCFCCDDFAPADETAGKEKGYDIYQTCVDEPVTDAVAEKAAADKAGGGKFQGCLNKINIARHNFYRTAHGVPLLNDFSLIVDDKEKA